MTDRPIIYPQEQMRGFDFVGLGYDVLVALADTMQDALGSTATVVGGMVATQTTSPSLTINLTAGRIYTLADADATGVGDIPQSTLQILQQGQAAAQTVLLSTSGIAAGQSRWALIEAQFSQADSIAAGDPNGGVMPFYNAANPSEPLNGQGGSGNPLPTTRQGLLILQVITGSAASTGSEAPPSPTGGWTPLYLVDLTYGQTTITNSEILEAGPSAGLNVPSNYPQAPFLTGLLNSHHGGILGQAPKIKLASEVQGVLPYANMSPVRQILTNNLTLYVNASTGSDSNNGLTSGTAFQTIQHAWNVLQSSYDLNGYTVTIQLAAGTYAPLSASGQTVGCFSYNNVILNGNTSAPGTVIVQASNGSNAIGASQGALLTIQGLTVTTTGSGSGNGIIVGSGAYTTLGPDVIFGTCTGAQIYVGSAGNFFAANAYTISGGSTQSHLFISQGNALLENMTVTLTGSPAFSAGFVNASECGVINFVAVAFSGAATGSRYQVGSNAVIQTNGSGATYLPGSTAGSANNGGLYL